MKGSPRWCVLLGASRVSLTAINNVSTRPNSRARQSNLKCRVTKIWSHTTLPSYQSRQLRACGRNKFHYLSSNGCLTCARRKVWAVLSLLLPPKSSSLSILSVLMSRNEAERAGTFGKVAKKVKWRKSRRRFITICNEERKHLALRFPITQIPSSSSWQKS